MSTTPHPWDRQDGEPDKAWKHFCSYRDLGPDRSLARTASDCGLTVNAMGLHSARWAWGERAAAYDSHVDEQQRLAFIREAREAGKRQAAHARVYQDALLGPAVALAKRLAGPLAQVELEQLPTHELFALTAEAARAWPAVAKMERLALGQATEEIVVSQGEQRSIPLDPQRMAQVFAALAEAGLTPAPELPIIEGEVIELLPGEASA